MRTMLAAAFAALLAGCQVPEPAAENGAESNALIATPDSSSGSPTQTQTVSPLDAIPAAFHGRYDESRAACTRASEYRLVITGSELRFHESIGKVRSVKVEAPGSAFVTADYEGEGERWSNSRQLLLSKDGTSIMISGDDTAITRIRCQ